MKVRTLIPNIRFRGFSDPWEQRKLESVVIVYDKGRVPVTSTERISGDTPYYGANGIQDYVDGYTHDGEFTLIAEDGANDTRNYPIKFVSGKIWVNNHAHVLAGKQNILNTRFLSFSLQQINIEPFLSGSGRAKLNASEMKKLLIAVPNIYEQIKVENFLGEMAHLIAANEDKVQQLKTLKKLMMQKIFSQEWRFKGFTDPWEQRKLQQIAKVFDGTHQTPEYVSNGVPFVSVENIKTLKTNKYISNNAFQNNFKIFPQKGDIFMTRIGNIGSVNIVENNKDLAYYVSLALIRPEHIRTQYLAQYISSQNGQRQLWRRTLHVAFPKKINKNEISKINIFYPDNVEQEKIGSLIIKLDHLIAANEDKLNQLKRLKKYLMQNLFV
ncbi:restriction endonuclease subunit S [Lactiplantibacillus plantarum]|uniref:restriction endonuclease subunit S n=1 Tax=Lactiplantibacillus plantarum TaxID=1590 RepID=UPI0005E785CD|nr:restriction endonuclease subunit S [Lactiplantibacillus plantarum]MBX4154503.1 restriction endonuclease subunit S [Lactiplantibacillus plantarum]MED7643497.1 restriction endonuclease subunit S [Lactiplantibacillus plantarum]NVO64483.1 restriction endonuclease subunit S [Lactiplantibacillus plantarum]QOF02540.1 restriction endonuclease subunit S [Lactiplantibacillus plantarum]UVO58107.1 restriction endonuclease subunit S [Lactiplantibacillus plantarum]